MFTKSVGDLISPAKIELIGESGIHSLDVVVVWANAFLNLVGLLKKRDSFEIILSSITCISNAVSF